MREIKKRVVVKEEGDEEYAEYDEHELVCMSLGYIYRHRQIIVGRAGIKKVSIMEFESHRPHVFLKYFACEKHLWDFTYWESFLFLFFFVFYLESSWRNRVRVKHEFPE